MMSEGRLKISDGLCLPWPHDQSSAQQAYPLITQLSEG